MFSQKPNSLREWGPATSTTFDNSFRRFFDQEEGIDNFSKFRQKELTEVVEVAGPHSGKKFSFMFLFQQPRLENEKPSSLPEWGPATSTTLDNSLKRFFDQDEGTEYFTKYR